MDYMKTPTSIRLRPEAVSLLDAIGRRNGTSRAGTIEQLLSRTGPPHGDGELEQRVRETHQALVTAMLQ